MEFISTHLPGLLKMSAEASVVILLVMAAQWLCGRRLEARWRHVLWMLVVLRLVLPWTIPSPASLFNVVKLPATAMDAGGEPARAEAIVAPSAAAQGTRVAAVSQRTDWLARLWAAGALALAGCVLVSQYKFRRRVGELRPLTDGPTLDLLEDCKALMGIRTPVTIVETDAVKGPALFGFVRPRLLLPKGLLAGFSREELRHVFLHELAHIKRHDILVAWVVSGLQIAHWFNPLVWVAFSRLRADRELACDALALSYTRAGENESYGLTIVKLLEGFGRPVWGPGMAGILENKKQLKERMTMIASFRKPNRGIALAILLLAGLAVVTLTDARLQTPSARAAQNEPDASRGVWVVKFEPVGDFKPRTPEEWLEKTHAYGLYSGKHGEIGYFRTTKQGNKLVGSFLADNGKELKAALGKISCLKVTSVKKLTQEELVAYEKLTQESFDDAVADAPPPRIVATSPSVGASDVDPSITEITVTFDSDMAAGFSWTGGGPDYPASPKSDTQPKWIDKRSCALPVSLEAAHFYRVGINSQSYRNFRTKDGIPALPSAIYFTTRGASDELKQKLHAPRVVSMTPENGATDVSPSVKELRVTFNIPMGGGFSWCGDPSTAPPPPKGTRPYWTKDFKTCVLPVELKPNSEYELSLNTEEFRNFTSQGGLALEPVVYKFKTASQ